MNNSYMKPFSDIKPKSRRFWSGLISLVLIPGLAFASFSLSDMPTKILPKTPYYTIQDISDSKEPGMLHFKIYSPHGLYEIDGFLPLEKLLREIEVIERVTHQDAGTGFMDGASDSVEATVTGLGNLVAHPVDSVQGLGKATGKLGRSVGGMFRKKGEGEKSSMGETLMGGNQREVAKRIGADVYSRNPHMKSLINRMASSRMGGQGAVMVIKFLIPVAALASVAMTAGSLNSQADQLVNDTSRGDLYRQNIEALKIMGFDQTAAKRFLDMPYLTPREQTYFRFYLDSLKRVEGFGGIFQSMVDSKDQWDAFKKLFEAQMAAGGKHDQFAKIWSYPEGIGALELSGNLVFITAYDTLEADATGKKVLDRIRALRAQNHLPVELRNGGQITDDFRSKARRDDIRIKPWAFFQDGDPK